MEFLINIKSYQVTSLNPGGPSKGIFTEYDNTTLNSDTEENQEEIY